MAKYKVESEKFGVVFETNLSLDEANDFINKTQQEELELFLKNREVFRIVEQTEELEKQLDKSGGGMLLTRSRCKNNVVRIHYGDNVTWQTHTCWF